ncbi:MAG: hypothetical protein LUC43_05965, partial [Burkholderiales bacterium]|nr:hypothetical protein [Burkholderiales bacterium]
CKQIKANIETLEKNKAQVQALENGSGDQEIGPTVRCFRLGQNWQEFSTCAQSLGYKPEIKPNLTFIESLPARLKPYIYFLAPSGPEDGEILMLFSGDLSKYIGGKRNTFQAGPVVAFLDKDSNVQVLIITTPKFFGTERFDRSFLQAFVDNYKIPELTPQSLYWQLFNIIKPIQQSGVAYSYESPDGWGVKVADALEGSIAFFYKTGSSKKDFTF